MLAECWDSAAFPLGGEHETKHRASVGSDTNRHGRLGDPSPSRWPFGSVAAARGLADSARRCSAAALAAEDVHVLGRGGADSDGVLTNASLRRLLHGIDLYRDQVYLQQKMLYADNIIVVCDYNQQFVAERYKEIYDRIAPKIRKYHLGLDFAELPYTPDNRRTQTVLAVGKFEAVKGFKYLLRAIHKLRLQGLNIELELIGYVELAGSLRELSKKLNIGDRVTFRGWLPFDQVRAAMMSATIFVLPSLGDAVPTVIK